ncbi:APH(3') family aminoglycoside O-phosphotransferase [Nakamurella sp. A5-74]|uniref:APH(3') family aminoglycoside O-phosphotransferase n=1 Tax=Nakamurella sp. A5-74 TaxID=3158264 RepID=A0AAU8DQP3_9ACTN
MDDLPPSEAPLPDFGWVAVRLGLSGASVLRSTDGRRYRKSVSGVQARTDLIAERDRLFWLARIGFPAARVIDWTENGSASTATLTTATVPGVPISSVSGSDAGIATRSLALLLRDLHAVPTASCPFDRTLSVTVPRAQSAVADGLVDVDDFDAERGGLPPSQVLQQLIKAAPRAATAESADLVVCHGDACLPNVLVDPETFRPTGIVDVGRLGVADRHKDLALATRSLADPELNPAFGPSCAELFVETYVIATGLEPARVDPERIAFYRLLDEFF